MFDRGNMASFRTGPLCRTISAIALLLLAAVALSDAAFASPRVAVDIKSGPLSQALVELGLQAKVPIIMMEPDKVNLRVRRLKGRLRVEDALQRLLRGTGLVFRATRSGDLVVTRRPSPPPGRAMRAPPRAPPRPAPVRETGSEPIIVTASKTRSTLLSYPGSVSIVDMEEGPVSARPDGGTSLLIDQLPMLSGTSLGPGRNKIFSRGIADSSYPGFSQGNVAIYLDEHRINYSGPDPDLRLVDVRRVEVLGGPYGTLYGVGALGGVIRIVSRDPEIDTLSGSIAADLLSVKNGAIGSRLSAVTNIPLGEDAAIRGVVYRDIDPGFIDDLSRGKKDINRVARTGGRLVSRWEAGADWTIDLGLAYQRIKARDSQYSNDALDPLLRGSSWPQPYFSTFLMPALMLRKDWGDLELVSATSWNRRRSDEIRELPGLLNFSQARHSYFLSHDSRLIGRTGDVSLIGGLLLGRSVDIARNSVGLLYDESIVELVRYDIARHLTDIAGYGEASLDLSDQWTLTIGGRLNHIRDRRRVRYRTWDLIDRGEPMADLRSLDGISNFGLSASLSLAWEPASNMLAFAAFRSGSRGGHIMPFSSTGGQEPVPVRSDKLYGVELGTRYSGRWLSWSTSLSYTRWDNILADFMLGIGAVESYTLGNVNIWAADATLAVRPVAGLSLSSALFFNNSPRISLNRELHDDWRSILPKGNRLPNISSFGARAAVNYEGTLGSASRLKLAAVVRYYGALVTELDGVQPDFVEIGLQARIDFGKFGFLIGVTNLTDVRGDRFALGNSSEAERGLKPITPLQPRTIRAGMEWNF